MGYEGRFERNVMKLLEANGFKRREANTHPMNSNTWFYIYERGRTSVFVHEGKVLIHSGDLWIKVPNESIKSLKDNDGYSIGLLLGNESYIDIFLFKEDEDEI